jgi:hypothetical protein
MLGTWSDIAVERSGEAVGEEARAHDPLCRVPFHALANSTSTRRQSSRSHTVLLKNVLVQYYAQITSSYFKPR